MTGGLDKAQPKGRFPDEVDEQVRARLDSSFTDQVVQRSSRGTVVGDIVYVIIVGFWSMLRGLLTADSKSDTTTGGRS